MYADIPPLIVIASSLGMILITSSVNSILYLRTGKKVNFKLISLMWVGMATGVLFGTYLATVIDPTTLKLIFGFTALAVAAKLVLVKSKSSEDAFHTWTGEGKVPLLMLITFCGGSLAGVTGLGGGAIMVPLFITFTGMPITLVPLYSNLMMVAGSLVGVTKFTIFTQTSNFFDESFLYYGQVGSLNLIFSTCLFMGAITTASFGVKLNRKVSQKNAKKAFAVLLTIVGLRIVLIQLKII